MTKPERYIHDVLKGKIKTGRFARLAVERHVKDLKRKRWGYHFDVDAGLEAITRMESFRHHGGKLQGQPFILTGWQAFVVYTVFGWQDRAGHRRFKYVYIEVAKKNGKTMFAAIVALFLMIMDGERNAEVYTFASHKDQAKICFDDCKKMMEQMVVSVPSVKNKVWTGKNAVAWYPTDSKIAAMSKDKQLGGKKEGIRAHGGICDEYHAHEDNAVFEQVQSSMINRDQPLMWMITTAGHNKLGPCYAYRANVIEILEGTMSSEITFGMIFTIDEKDIDEKGNVDLKVSAIKSNPSLDVPGCVQMKNLLLEYDDAKKKGASILTSFMTKNLNRWMDTDEVWMQDRVWMKNSHGIKPTGLEEKICYGGLDLASGVDFNAFTLFFPEVKPKIHAILSWYWKPHALIVDRRQKRDYRQWVAEGHILDAGEDKIDFGVITEKIKELAGCYDLRSIAYDPYLANHGAVQDLQAYGISMNHLAQTMSQLSTPTKELEALITAGELEHFGNPVTRWMMGNVKIIRDSKGNIMITKGKSKGQVDGPSSLVNAIGEWMTFRDQEPGDGFMVISTKKKT